MAASALSSKTHQQRQHALDECIDFWQGLFQGAEAGKFPPRPTSATGRHSAHRCFQSSFRSSSFDLSTCFLAAWTFVLGRYSELQQDVVFGVSGDALRPMLPIRICWSPDLSVHQFLAEVQKQLSLLQRHGAIDVQDIRDLSDEAKHACSYRSTAQINHRRPVTENSQVVNATVSLSLACFIELETLEVQAVYAAPLELQQVNNLLAQLEHVFHQLTGSGNSTKLIDIDPCSPSDIIQIQNWNSKPPAKVEAVVHQVFELQCTQRPDALAVRCWDRDLTYSALNDLSLRLAHYLVCLGVGPETVVPTCFDKSAWAVVSMLAIMRAGGACVNLGPSHPLDRKKKIIQACDAMLVVTTKAYSADFETFLDSVVIVDERFLTSLPLNPFSRLPIVVPSNKAYVLFTSGSTGEPKGIVIEHGSLCTSAEAHGSKWNIGPGTRVFQFASFTFDVSVADIFFSIMRGACVCIPSEEERINDPAAIAAQMSVNWANLTPSVASLLHPDQIPSLRTLVLGGEAPTRKNLEDWANSVDLILCTGPAETTIHLMGSEPVTPYSSPTEIGRAVGGRVWVVDPLNHHRLAPIGTVGEMFIEGRIVSRGYLNLPEKTAASYFEEMSWLPGDENLGYTRRTFKSGDLIRQNADGTFDFVGRKDGQVKIRGQRVELEEIEHQMKLNLPDLERAVPYVRSAPAQHGRHQLVAFIIFKDQIPTPECRIQPLNKGRLTQLTHLKEALVETLTSYMVPSLYIPLTKLPLTLNGKNDQRKLAQIIEELSDEDIRTLALVQDTNDHCGDDMIDEEQNDLQSAPPSLAQSIAPAIPIKRLPVDDFQADVERDTRSRSSSDLDTIMKWNESPPSSMHDTIHNVFAQQVTMHPNAPAICSSDISRQISYAQLQESATRLAIYLMQKGLQHGEVVPLCFDKSAIAIASMLAVMMSGAACAFLSPSYPASRSKNIISACKAQHILADPYYVHRFGDLNLPVIAIDQPLLESLPNTIDRVMPVVLPTDVAFVAFTSGSTGIPKGVVIEHKSYTTVAVGVAQRLGIGVGTRILQFSAYTFDIGLGDLTFSLMHGACICTPNEQERLNDLEGVTNRMQANWAFFVASMANTLVPKQLPTLRTLVVGGEPPTKNLVEVWAEDVNLHIIAGPAETSVYCMSADNIPKSADPRNAGMAISCRLWIAQPDDYENLIPTIGSVGELLVEGDIVARGYLGNAELTEQLFVEEPCWLPPNHTDNHRRLYRTGDLAQYNDDGSINILGRKDQDDQIKIRGQRVALGEIAYYATRNLPGVGEAIPLVNKEHEGRYELVIFLQYKAEADSVLHNSRSVLDFTVAGMAQIHAMRNLLADNVPDYMVPSLFIPISRTPYTMHRKMDYGRLRELLRSLTNTQLERFCISTECDEVLSEPETSYPSSEASKLCEMWSAILGVDSRSIGPNSHFLQLGGDSLKAMHLSSLAKREGFLLRFADIMTQSRLSKMALALETSRSDDTTLLPSPFSLLESGRVEDFRQAAAVACCTTVRAIEDIYPCSPLQEGLFSLSSKNPGSYVSHWVFKLRASIDLDRLMSAWNMVYEQVDIMRTRVFLPRFSRPLQVVVQDKISWRYAQDMVTYLSRDEQDPMGPGVALVRMGIIQSGEDRRFILTMHHVLFDGFTLPLLLTQWLQAYKGHSTSTLTPYKVFINHLNHVSHEEMGHFWSARLKEAIKPNWPPESTKNFQRQLFKHTMPLTDTSMQSNAEYTLSTKIQAAYATLLSLYENDEDVVFGLTVSGRGQPLSGIENMPGPTIATIPFRCKVLREQSIAWLLQNVHSDVVSMSKFEQWGLQNIQRINANTADACAFRSLLIIQPKEDRADTHDLVSLETPITESLATYSIVVECQITDMGLDLTIEYNAEVMSESEAQRFAQQFQHVLVQMMTLPAATQLSKINVLSAADQSKISALNNVQPLIVDKCVHWMIQQTSQWRASHEAICAWDDTLTYAELDSASANMAAHFRNMGVGPQVVVPVYADKSAWSIVAMYAILRAGGAFVPLDSSNPVQRVRDIISQVEARTIVVSHSLRATFEKDVKHVVVPTRTMTAESILAFPLSLEEHSPGSICYIIFTSGSTGRPKGVAIEHRSYLSGALSRLDLIFRNKDSRVLQFNSYSFDACIEDIFTTLIVGGTICVPTKADLQSDLTGSINSWKANCIDLTPSVVALLNPADVPGLKSMIVGGEALTSQVVSQWADKLKLAFTYGPSECAIVSTITRHLVPNSDPTDIGTMSCGNAWIADPQNHNRLVPYGCVGELLLDGPTLARGYLHDTEKTTATFITGAPWCDTGRRLYKTGDLVRYLDSGNLQFIGRKDTQIKIRGQRVELSEIERHLKLNSKARDLAVEFVKFRNGRQMLAAFFCFEDMTKYDFTKNSMSEDLRQRYLDIEARIMENLPKYMIPAVYVTLNSLPVTVSGKLDRRKLRSMILEMPNTVLDGLRLAFASTMNPVETECERIVQSLWSGALSINASEIGKTSNFFALGGDSIDAMRLASASRQDGFALTVDEVFRTPILMDMANLLSIRRGKQALVQHIHDSEPFFLLDEKFSLSEALSKSGTALEMHHVVDAYPATPLQEGLVALSARQEHAYVAQFIYKLKADIDIKRFSKTWLSVNRMNAILRTRILYVDGYGSIQVVLRGAETMESSESLPGYLSATKLTRMGYGTPLSRHCIVHDHEDGHSYFVHTIHHALFDGYTMGQLSEQASKLYQLPDVITPSSPPFTRFVQYLQGIDQNQSKLYWREQLQGTPSTEIFRDQPEAATRTEAVTRSKMRFECITRSHTLLASTTMAMLIRTAWSLTLCQYTDSDDVVFGMTLTGRNAPIYDIENLCGPTMTTVPIRAKIDGKRRIVDFVSDLSDQAMRMTPHEHYGLSNMRKLNPNAVAFESILVVQPGEEQAFCTELMEPVQLSQDEHDLCGESGYHAQTLVLVCSMRKDGINFKAVHNSAVLPQALVKAMLDCFSATIQRLCSPLSPESTVSCIAQQPATAMKSEQLLETCKSLSDVILTYPTTNPDTLALLYPHGQMSYSELRKQSSRIAKYVLTRFTNNNGVTQVVPLLFKNPTHMLVTACAMITSGICFTILDPTAGTLETRRNLHLLQANILLTDLTCPWKLESDVETIIKIDDVTVEMLPDGEMLYVANSPKIAALAILDSTALTPEGIKIYSSGGLATIASSMRTMGSLDPTARLLYVPSKGLSIAVILAISALANGACVVVDDSVTCPLKLRDGISNWKINWVLLESAVVKAMGQPEDFPSIRTMLLYREFPPERLIDTWSVKINLYYANGQSHDRNVEWLSLANLHGGTSPFEIGTGIGCQLDVIGGRDPSKPVVPAGAPGEIMVSGLGVAVRQRDLRIHAWQPGLRHATGIRGRQILEGDAIVRGFSTSGIDHDLLTYHLQAIFPEFEVAAHTILQKTGPPILCTFIGKEPVRGKVAPSEILQPSEDDLKCIELWNRDLRYRVPKRLLPKRHLFCTYIPRTPEGQLESRSLQALANRHETNLQLSNPAKSDVEKLLRRFWGQILSISEEKIRSEDSFFTLGGDSIAAMRLAVALTSHSKETALTVADIFRSQTLSNMAARLKPILYVGKDVIPPLSLLPEPGVEPSSVRRFSAVLKSESKALQDVYPCTPQQEALMTLSTQHEGAYVAYFVYRLPANIIIEKLQLAWQSTVDAFDNLRTRIIENEEGESLQVLLKAETIEWIRSDTIQAALARTDHKPTGFGQKLVHFHLVMQSQTNGDRHLVIHMNHAIYDAYTVTLMVNFTENVYHGRPTHTPTRYNRFIDHIQQVPSQAIYQFWLAEMDGLHAKHYPITPQHVQKRASARATIWSELAFRPGNFTTSIVAQASWALVVGANSDSNDVIFGLNLSGRDTSLTGIESVAGPTLMMIPRRVQIFQSETCIELLGRMQDSMAGIIEYGHVGIQGLKKLPGLQNLTLNNILVVHLASTRAHNTIHEATSPPAELDFHTAPLVINVMIYPHDDARTFKVEMHADYDSNLVSEVVANRLLHQLVHVMGQLQDPKGRIRDVEVCTLAERTVIESWAPSPVTAAAENIVGIMAAQAQEPSIRTGVTAADGSFTWRDIELYSALLACKLRREYQCSRGDVVALDLRQTRWIVVAIVAVLKAGAAFIITDDRWTEQKDSVLWSRTCIKAYITCGSFDPAALGMGKSSVMRIGSSFVENLLMSKDLELEPPYPADVAYVSLINGPRGKIQPLRTTHEAICQAFRDNQDDFRISKGTRWLQSSFIHPDMASLAILSVIMAGGCLMIGPTAGPWDDAALKLEIKRQNPTHVFLPSATVPFLDPNALNSAVNVVLYGTPPKLSGAWVGRSVLSIYSPPLAPMQFSVVKQTGENRMRKRLRILGLRTQVTQPDDTSRLAPIGAVGELCIEVPDRTMMQIPAKGSRNLLQWHIYTTNERGGTFHRTGDLVKYEEDGTLRLMSHKSERNVVSGQRVLVEDVEDVVRHIIAGTETVSVVAEFVKFSDAPHRKFVVFFAAKFDRECSGIDENSGSQVGRLLENKASMLKATLSHYFPAFMMPRGYVILQALPITERGKVDRNQLARVAGHMTTTQLRSFTNLSAAQILPVSAMEISMREMWSKVLRVEEASIHKSDSFIPLGGDSISAMRLVAFARSQHIAFSVVDVLSSTNLADLSKKATIMTQHSNNEASDKSMRLIAERQTWRVRRLVKDRALRDRVKRHISPDMSAIEDVAIAHDYQTGAVLSGLTSRRGWSNYVVVDFMEPIDARALEVACNTLFAHNPILRTVFLPHKQSLLQIVYREIDFKIRHFDNIDDIARASKVWTDKDKIMASTLLKRDIRAASFRHNDGRMRLVLGLSHALWDGISLAYIHEDLFAACQNRQLQRRSNFTEYAHFAANDNTPIHTAYWQQLLNGSHMTQIIENLAPSFERPLNATLEKRVFVPIALGTHGFTFATILKAAWAMILARWSSSTEVLFGHLVSGRAANFPDVDRVTGPCLGLIPVRVTVSDEIGTMRLLRQVHDQQLASTPHEHIGFERIVRRATNWPRWTRCSTMVQHQNHGSGSTAPGYRTSLICPQHDSADILVISDPLDSETMSVTLSFCRETLDTATMQTVLDQLCNAITRLLKGLVYPDLTLVDTSIWDPIGLLPELPISRQRNRHDVADGPQPPSACEMTARHIWQMLDLPTDSGLDKAFYEISGSITPAVQMVEILQDEHGLEATIEDILRVPTIRGLAHLLMRRGRIYS